MNRAVCAAPITDRSCISRRMPWKNAADAPLLYSSLADSVTGLPNASGEYCICVTQADGALSLSLECLDWEVLELDDDREEAVFYGKDPSYPVRVEIHVRSTGIGHFSAMGGDSERRERRHPPAPRGVRTAGFARRTVFRHQLPRHLGRRVPDE